MSQADVRAQIDRIEREFVAEWGAQGQWQLAQTQERCARAREALLPLTLGQRLQRFMQRAAATLLAAHRI